jgi:hypothetical protein
MVKIVTADSFDNFQFIICNYPAARAVRYTQLRRDEILKRGEVSVIIESDSESSGYCRVKAGNVSEWLFVGSV